MSVSMPELIVTKTAESRLSEVDPAIIQFGKIYSDHMLIAYYENGAWKQPEIMPYANLSLSPATTFMHYGQAIFEGIKSIQRCRWQPTGFQALRQLEKNEPLG